LENRTGCASSPDFLVASAHKFHGPKSGVCIYKKNSGLQPFIGGEQEKDYEQELKVHQIVGMENSSFHVI
jgi:cysteine sulfinate desulfinase/cysteine desulfurase-like protein